MRHIYVNTSFFCVKTGESIKETTTWQDLLAQWMVPCIVCFFVLVIVVIGMLITHRKREHSTLWFPEGFFLKKEPSSNKNRREPVGQDALGLK